MKKDLIKKLILLLAVSLVSAGALTACKSTSEHPHGSEHPKSEHPR